MSDSKFASRKHHADCDECGTRTVHVRKGQLTWECMACGNRFRNVDHV